MTNYSDEIINAYVDGELDGPEKEKFKQDIKLDEQLAEKVHSICELKKTLKSNYGQMPLPESGDRSRTGFYQSYIKSTAVAVLVLCVGLFLGININSVQIKSDFAGQNDVINGVKLTPVDLQQPNKIILHVSESDPEVLYKTLYQIDSILQAYSKSKKPFELEVVANSGGIDLFRNDVSPYKDRIKQIIKNYNNVSFIACSNAMEKLRLKGIEPDLIADTKTGVTAIDQIVKRLQEGWVYLKV
jgi:uncharacterized protein